MKLLLLSLALFGSTLASLRAGDVQWSKKREAANSPSSSSVSSDHKTDADCKACMESGWGTFIPYCDPVCPDRKKREAAIPPGFPEMPGMPKMPEFPAFPSNGNSNTATSNTNIQIGKREAANSPSSSYGSPSSNAESSSSTNYKKRQATQEECDLCLSSGGRFIPNCDHMCPDRKRKAAMPPGFPEMPGMPKMPEFPAFPGNGNSNSAGSTNNVPDGAIVHSTNTVNKKREVYHSCKCDTNCNNNGCHKVCKQCDDNGCRNVSHCNRKRETEYLERLRRSIQVDGRSEIKDQQFRSQRR